MLQENLIFIVSPPRSGSTLLQRMLASHSAIYSHPEPHLLTPLNYLGYYDTVDKAPYDHINAAQALREFCQELPRGEEDYLDALRAYANTLYERVLAPTGKTHFLDKTPAYTLVWPFMTRLYPRARYVVLTRHPLAIMHSVAHSFFAGDYAAAEANNPIVRRYVPALADFMTEARVPFVHVRYEDLVRTPEAEMQRIFAQLGLPYEPGVINYGDRPHISKSYGDPVAVQRHTRPVQDSQLTWTQDLLARPEAFSLASNLVQQLSDTHLKAWGYDKASLFADLGESTPQATQRRNANLYALKRQVLLALRRNMHQSAVGSVVKKVRYYCDVLLRAT